MQSAFVDIGLERDAFLYVSDFMELESTDDELDEVPAALLPQERRPAEPSGVEPATHAEAEEKSAAEESPVERAEGRTNGDSAAGRHVFPRP